MKKPAPPRSPSDLGHSPPALEVAGYAIVSADGKIADRDGRFPESLRFEADQTRFQDALSSADLTLLGRRTHEAAPNTRRRNRLVLSSGVEGLFREDTHTIWCNPNTVDLETVVLSLALETGRVAVAGGTTVYHLVGATLGYAAFSLTVADAVRLPGGIPLLPGCDNLGDTRLRLESFGLRLDRRRFLDRTAGLYTLDYRKGD